MSATSEQARRMLDNRISRRMEQGWYPSTRDPETGDARHDRHVMIWVRNYEHLIETLCDEIDSR